MDVVIEYIAPIFNMLFREYCDGGEVEYARRTQIHVLSVPSFPDPS
jgi:hypothetical protein